jgi:2-dehydropantoate 2-reductase
LCIAMESISVAAQRRGGGASWQDSITVARGMRGAFAVIKGLGYPLYPSGKARLSSMPIPLVASMLWSVSRIPSFRDLLATGIDECRMLVDVVAKAGNEMRPALPSAVAAVLAMKPKEVSAKLNHP